MIIDGSKGHGGGQIIRTATALSAITGKSFKIKNIRAKRPNPGLRPQHLQGINAVAELCDAEVDGNHENSTKLEFIPKKIQPKRILVDTQTAGSVTLVLQTILLPCFQAKKPVEIEVRGGTDVKWSPPIDHQINVLQPILNKMGFKSETKLEKRGYYPKGGGKITTKTFPSQPKNLKLTEKTEMKKIFGISHASKKLQKARVAERQAEAAKKLLGNPEIKIQYHETPSIGTGIQLWAKTENSVLGANALGQKGVPAETIGEKAVERLLAQEGAVDEWTTDQIVPYMALTENSQILASKISEHCKTNMEITQKFTDKKFIVEDRLIKVGE